jgi:hypothetical protein
MESEKLSLPYEIEIEKNESELEKQERRENKKFEEDFE